jgi:hypothetical protein
MKKIYFLLPLVIFLIFCFICNSGCKKEAVTNTVIQQDTVIRRDTTTISYGAIQEYNTGDSSEQTDFLHVQQSHSWNAGEVIYAVKVSDLKKEDIVFVVGEFEVTNDNDYETGLYTQIILANHSYDVPNDPGWSEVSESNGTYVTQTQHHYTVTQFGTYECTSDLGTKWINLAAYAVYNHAGANDNLKVELDYGRLSVIIYRKN